MDGSGGAFVASLAMRYVTGAEVAPVGTKSDDPSGPSTVMPEAAAAGALAPAAGGPAASLPPPPHPARASPSAASRARLATQRYPRFRPGAIFKRCITITPAADRRRP